MTVKGLAGSLLRRDHSICESEGRGQPPGNSAQLESVAMHKGESEGRKRTRVDLGKLVRFFCGSCNPAISNVVVGSPRLFTLRSGVTPELGGLTRYLS